MPEEEMMTEAPETQDQNLMPDEHAMEHHHHSHASTWFLGALSVGLIVFIALAAVMITQRRDNLQTQADQARTRIADLESQLDSANQAMMDDKEAVLDGSSGGSLTGGGSFKDTYLSFDYPEGVYLYSNPMYEGIYVSDLTLLQSEGGSQFGPTGYRILYPLNVGQTTFKSSGDFESFDEILAYVESENYPPGSEYETGTVDGHRYLKVMGDGLRGISVTYLIDFNPPKPSYNSVIEINGVSYSEADDLDTGILGSFLNSLHFAE